MDIVSDLMLLLNVAAAEAVPVLLDAAVKGAAIFVLAWGVVSVLGRTAAAVRHLIWGLAFGVVLLLPALSTVVPRWELPGLGPIAPSSAAIEAPDRGVAASPGTVVSRGGAALPSVGSRAEVPPTADGEALGRAVAASQEPLGTGTIVSAAVSAKRLPVLGLSAWILLIWLTGCGAALLTVAAGVVGTWRIARAARVVGHGPLHEFFLDLCREFELRRRTALLVADGSTMPMTWGLRPRVIVPADARDWTDARLRAVLSHELAHVKRGDYGTQLMARLVSAVHWFNPLVWWALHRLRVERERACDDHVLNAGLRASEYAEHLLEMARSMRVHGLAAVTSVPMAGRSPLTDRLVAVLDATERRTELTPRLAVVGVVLALLIVVPVAGAAPSGRPAVEPTAISLQRTTAAAAAEPEPVRVAVAAEREAPIVAQVSEPLEASLCDWSKPAKNTSTSSNIDDDEMRIRIRRDDCRLEIDVSGQITFDDKETDIVGLSPGGYLEIEERNGAGRRKLEIRADQNGVLERRWYVDGDRRPYDDEARQWLAELLPSFFRLTGLNAEARASRILSAQGVDGLLQEISLIASDHIARRYYEILITRGNLSNEELRRIVRQAGSEIRSDYELAELLTGIAESDLVDEAVMLAYVEAARTLSSDHEQRRALRAILTRPDLSREVAHAMLGAATDISSDYELAELLIALVHAHPIEATMTPQYFAAVETINSDFEHGRVLKALLAQGGPNLEVLDRTLASARRIQSDVELAELLLHVGDLYPLERGIPPSYLAAARTIDSDSELGRVLSALIRRGDSSQAALRDVLAVAVAITSDFEAASLLTEIARRFDLTNGTRSEFFRVLDGVNSDYEHGRVLRQVLERDPVIEVVVADVLESALDIGSDHELVEVLVIAARRFPLNDRLRTAYMMAVETLSSTYERERAMAALVAGGTARQ